MQTEQKAEQIIITGNNIDSLKNYPDNFFDSIVTDPPYGLGKEPNAEEMLQAWITTGYLEVKGAGFMGKEWEKEQLKRLTALQQIKIEKIKRSLDKEAQLIADSQFQSEQSKPKQCNATKCKEK